MDHESYLDPYLRDILKGVRTIPIVDASPGRERSSHGVMAYLQREGYIGLSRSTPMQRAT